MATGIICQMCGVEAPTRYVEFHRNIGAVVIRFHNSIRGQLCKKCVHKYFWEYTLVNLTVGWLGVLSLIMTPFLVLNNIIRYCMVLGMPAVPPGAGRPIVDQGAMQRLSQAKEEIIRRINAGEKLIPLAMAVAPSAGVTPGQVVQYVVMLAQPQRQQAQPPTYGFPVQPLPALPVLPAQPSAIAAQPPPPESENLGL